MANGIELAPLVCEIKANLDNYNKGVDEAERKGTALEEEFKKLNSEAKLNESSFKLAGAGAELLGNKTNILATKQAELTEKLKLQSRAIDLNKTSLQEASEKLNNYSKKNKELENNIKDLNKEQEIAKRTYGANSKEVKELQDKLDSLNKEFKENDEAVNKATEEMNHYKIKLNESQAELLQTQTAIKKNNEEIKKVKVDSINEKLNKTSSVLKDVGSCLTTYITLPLLAAGTAAAKVGMDFEAKMSRVKAISGATEEQFKTLTDQALELGQKTAFSASECAEGMENLASAGFSVNETTEAMPGLLDLAASAGEDLATSSDIAASTLRGFGLEAKQAGHVADVLAKNAGATNAAVKDTGEAMKYIAPNARAAGLSLEEVTAAIGELANAGIKGGQAGTTLRTALVRLAKPSDPAATAMERIGFTAFDSSGKMKSLATIMGELNEKTKKLTDEQKQNTIATIFGTEALSGMTVLMQDGKEGLTDLTEQLKNCDGAANEMARTMQDNTKSALEQAGGALETASIKILNIVAPTIRDLAEDVGSLVDKFSALSPETQELILKLGMLGIASGPVISLLGKGAGFLTKITPLIVKTGVEAGTAGIKIASAGAAAGTASVSLGALASVALPLVGALGAIAGGVYLMVESSEAMNTTCLKSKEELGGLKTALKELGGEVVLSAEEMDKANIKHKEWSKDIAPETQKALTETSDKVANLNFELENIKINKIADKQKVNSLAVKMNELFNNAEKKLKERQPQIQKDLADSFKADDGKLDKNEQDLLKEIQNNGNEQAKEIKKLEEEKNKIFQESIKNGGEFSKEQLNRLQEISKKIGDITKNNTIKTQSELEAANIDFQARMKQLDLKGISDLLQEKSKATEKEISNEKTKYDKIILEMKSQLPKLSEQGKKEMKTKIDQAEKTKKESIQKEKDKYLGYIKTAQTQFPNLLNEMDKGTGKLLTSQEKYNVRQLERHKQQFSELNKIAETGYYELYNNTTHGMDKCYVEVDKVTGEIKGIYDEKQKAIYGNPIKAREDIEQELKSGVTFKKIAGHYDDSQKHINDNPIKPKCEENPGIFDWIKTGWDNSIGYVLQHPIESFNNTVDTLVHGTRWNSNNYNGLDNVPYDGYIARLHKGERILTAEENARYSSTTDNSIQVTQNIYTDNASPYEIAKATKQGLRELQFVGR